LVRHDESADDAEWDRLYTQAEKYIKTGHHQYDKSIRHNLVLDALRVNQTQQRTFQQIPLAAQRKTDDDPFIEWSSAHTIFDLENRPNQFQTKERFNLFSGVLVKHLVLDSTHSTVKAIAVKDISANQRYLVEADVVILATGAVHNPQVTSSVSFAMIYNLLMCKYSCWLPRASVDSASPAPMTNRLHGCLTSGHILLSKH
jgi:pyranose oxidase